MGLVTGVIPANILKWYWWRFNGSGFFWGMVGGLVPALSFRFIFDGVLDLYTFPLMLLISLIGCIAGTYAAPPVEEVQPAGARVYQFGTEDLPVVLIFDESLDL